MQNNLKQGRALAEHLQRYSLGRTGNSCGSEGEDSDIDEDCFLVDTTKKVRDF